MKPEANLIDDVRTGVADPVEAAVAPVQMADRGTPNWARYISFLFSLGTGACIVSIAVLTVFFQATVAERGEAAVAPLLFALGLVPIVGALILDVAHARALTGYRAARTRTEAQAQGALGGLLFLVLLVIHPLAALPMVLSVGCVAAGLWALKRWGHHEPLWDFRPSEAVSILSGRDDAGLELAHSGDVNHALTSHVQRAAAWLGLVSAFAMGSWLAAQGILSVSAVAAVGLVSFWSVQAIGRFIAFCFTPDSALANSAATVRSFAEVGDEETAAAALAGLHVRNLSVETDQGNRLLSEVSFDVAPGEMVGVLGEAASGKSLLLQSLINPFDVAGLTVQGRVSYNGQDLWDRSNFEQNIGVVHVPPSPRMLPASGQSNVTCFQSEALRERASRCLESLVFSTDSVERILLAENAMHLSSSDQKALSLARAFMLSPSCYFLDRPEDFASDKLLAALCDRIKMERRAGRSFVVVTDNRAVLEGCDKLLMLQDGRMVDFAPAADIRGRLSSGWLRFVAARQLESEDTLCTWIKSQFKRGGDDANRRKVCEVGAELLAFSCQDVGPNSLERICFDFKHFEGYALLKLTDDGTLLTSGQMQLGHREAAADPKQRRSPLAKLIHQTEQIEQALVDNRRVITAKIETYDPRKSATKKGAKDA